MSEELTGKVIKLVSTATKIEEGKIKSETSFIDDLNLDSLDTVELMMQMEEEFDIEIPEEDASKLLTVKDVVSYIQGHQQ